MAGTLSQQQLQNQQQQQRPCRLRLLVQPPLPSSQATGLFRTLEARCR